uniref:CSON007367 protein n=1 Tax=Culicoides sonorensis TaxID=179676 RepID=A0A336LJP4_CULSO
MSSDVQVKKERPDEAEIRELAAKMSEQHKQQMAKIQQIQATQRVTPIQNSQNLQMVTTSGQTNILNYVTRNQKSSQIVNQQQLPSSSKTDIIESMDTDKKDEESQKGHFGWTAFQSGKVYIPYIFRQSEKYCAVRMVESKLLNKYLNSLHQDIYSCTCVRSYYITESESRLINEINQKHCDLQYGREPFTVKDLVVRLNDANKFYQFLDVCHRKLINGSHTPNEKCGFIRINKESVVPYTIRDDQKMVPLFYFEGETDNLKQKADYLSGWDLSYLKFCCKVQGIRNELFASDSVAVISLTDIKGYFPPGTEFEDYWPSKVVDTQLLLGSKTQQSSSVHWTRQPAQPPPKIHSTVVQSKTTISTNNNRKNVSMYSQNIGGNTSSRVNTNQTVRSPTDIAEAVRAWSYLSADMDPLLRQQVIASRMVQQQRTSYNTSIQQTRTQMQNLLSSPYGTYGASSNGNIPQITRNSSQPPPPLVRANQSQSAAAHMTQMAAAAMASLTSPQQQQRNSGSIVNGRSITNNSIHPQRSTSNIQTHKNDYRVIPHPTQSQDSTTTAAYQLIPYKVQKIPIQSVTVPCINMTAYVHQEPLMLLTDLKDIFFPTVSSLDMCRKLLATLDVQLYKGNRLQYQALQESGKTNVDGIPLVQVRDVLKCLPQLSYMVRTPDAPANKRARIS